MIFATVGTQLPFPRMIRILSDYVDLEPVDIIAQTISEDYHYSSIGSLKCIRSLSPFEFEDHVARANLIVSHAGIGSLITAARVGKPIAIIPRRSELGEHRNDHQRETARRLASRSGIQVFNDLSEFKEATRNTAPPELGGSERRNRLIESLSEFISRPLR